MMVITHSDLEDFCEELEQYSNAIIRRDTVHTYWVAKSVYGKNKKTPVVIHLPEDMFYTLRKAALLFVSEHVVKYYTEPCELQLVHCATITKSAMSHGFELVFDGFHSDLNEKISAEFSHKLREFVKGKKT